MTVFGGFSIAAKLSGCGYPVQGGPAGTQPVPGTVSQRVPKISGPLLDRIDIHINAPAVPYRELAGRVKTEPSAAIRARVETVRRIQARRFARSRIFANARLGSCHIRIHCVIGRASERMLENAVDQRGLSARACNRILKIARTLDGLENIEPDQIGEAIQYRSLDRKRNR